MCRQPTAVTFTCISFHTFSPLFRDCLQLKNGFSRSIFSHLQAESKFLWKKKMIQRLLRRVPLFEIPKAEQICEIKRFEGKIWKLEPNSRFFVTSPFCNHLWRCKKNFSWNLVHQFFTSQMPNTLLRIRIFMVSCTMELLKYWIGKK